MTTIYAAVLDRTGTVAGPLLDAAGRVGIDLVVTPAGPASRLGGEGVDCELIVVGPQELSATGLRRIARYLQERPATVAVAVGVEPADEPRVRQSGVAFTVPTGASPARLRRVLREAVGRHLRIVDQAVGWDAPAATPVIPEPRTEVVPYPDEPVAVEGPAAVAAESEAAPADEGDPEAAADAEATLSGPAGLLLTVASATGGCGKTFFATNLAAVCARAGRRVLLVDLDLQFGEIAPALHVKHPFSVYDGLYSPSGEPLPAHEFAAHLDELVAHHRLGFDVLTAPKDPVMADYVGARDATRILDVVLPRYDVVIVDTPPSLNEVVLTALDRSDLVAILATLDVPSLRNMAVFLETLNRLRIDGETLRLVLNKVEPGIGIDVQEAQDAFAGRFVARIPLARSVSRAINAGTVVVDMEPRSAVSRHLTDAVSAVLPPHIVGALPLPAQRRSESPWSRLFHPFRMPTQEVSREAVGAAGSSQ